MVVAPRASLGLLPSHGVTHGPQVVWPPVEARHWRRGDVVRTRRHQRRPGGHPLCLGPARRDMARLGHQGGQFRCGSGSDFERRDRSGRSTGLKPALRPVRGPRAVAPTFGDVWIESLPRAGRGPVSPHEQRRAWDRLEPRHQEPRPPEPRRRQVRRRPEWHDRGGDQDARHRRHLRSHAPADGCRRLGQRGDLRAQSPERHEPPVRDCRCDDRPFQRPPQQ